MVSRFLMLIKFLRQYSAACGLTALGVGAYLFFDVGHAGLVAGVTHG